MQPRTEKEIDNQLRQDVLKQLEWEPEVVSKDISVAVKDGVVTLTGFVHTYLEKLAAEKAAKSVYGVQAVAGDIEVKLGTKRSDPEIARDIVNAIELTASVPRDRLKICVREGFVTLEGMLDWNFQRECAETTARNIHGVQGLINNIELRRRIAANLVKKKIEDALPRSAEACAAPDVSAVIDHISIAP